MTPAGDWFLPVGSGFLARRTNLLSPSVTHLPVFKVTLITAADIKFDRVPGRRQQLFFGKSFAQDIHPRVREIQFQFFFKMFPIVETKFLAVQAKIARQIQSMRYVDVVHHSREAGLGKTGQLS